MTLSFRRIWYGFAITLLTMLSACDGDDGDDGRDGNDGQDALQSLIAQSTVAAGNEQCFKGGIRIDSGLDSNRNAELDADEITETSYLCNASPVNTTQNFNRIATFPVCRQLDADCNTDTETAAEIVAASDDGTTLIYTDSPAAQVGFIDITDPAMPQAAGLVDLEGDEPTSVAVKGGFALVAVNTSEDFINVAGELVVIGIAEQEILTRLDLGGQPDSIAVSPDGNYAAVVIENERDEDLGDGAPPQAPAGELVIVDIADADPQNWSSATVSLSGLADLFPGDPEPEYVDINGDNVAVLSLQENNHLVLVDLTSATVIGDFSAGAVDLAGIDITEGDFPIIDQSDSQDGVVREPDGVAWINSHYFATADEGDLEGGSRGFTVFNTAGDIVWNSGVTLDRLAARLGHYPDDRSGNKGNEPENIELGIFGGDRYLFVNSERSSLVFVYDVADPTQPQLKQVLPAAAGPEGGLAIPQRNLLVVASEEDDRGDKLRSAINIYRYATGSVNYPTLTSADRLDGSPIPWAALSGLAADDDQLYTVEDSFFGANRILRLDTTQSPAQVAEEIAIVDSNDVLAALPTADLADNSVADDDPSRVAVFDEADLAAIIRDDKRVNIDPEGIAVASDGGFWIASEGAGTVGDDERPINSLNMVIKTDAEGIIEGVVTLPESLNAVQRRFGFEGIAEYNGRAYVAFQRAWDDEANPRIGEYDPLSESWRFFFYPLDAVASQNGGWVGLSDLTSLGDGRFLVLERDNQGGPDAALKRLYVVDINVASDGDTLVKTLVRDLLDDLRAAAGLVYEKIEGLAVNADGEVFVVNDNDGVDDNSGETQLIRLGVIPVES